MYYASEIYSKTLKSSFLAKTRSGPQQLTTVVHGEFWENNILLAPDVCHVGDGVKVVDWKNAKIASATLDLVNYY
jgi:aminoglycoside phosphotransferase (APT) family kinase protein